METDLGHGNQALSLVETLFKKKILYTICSPVSNLNAVILINESLEFVIGNDILLQKEELVLKVLVIGYIIFKSKF